MFDLEIPDRQVIDRWCGGPLSRVCRVSRRPSFVSQTATDDIARSRQKFPRFGCSLKLNLRGLERLGGKCPACEWCTVLWLNLSALKSIIQPDSQSYLCRLLDTLANWLATCLAMTY